MKKKMVSVLLTASMLAGMTLCAVPVMAEDAAPENEVTGDASAETGHVTVDTDSGTIIISPAMLYIISDSAERPYMEDENGDPVPLTAPGWSVWMGSLAEGDRIIESTVKVTGEQTNKGLSGNSFEDKENIRIEDADGNDVTSNYTIVLLEGILTVT